MNILIVGSGAREYAIAKSLKKNKAAKLFGFLSSNNPGIIPLCESYCVGKVNDPESVVSFAQEQGIHLAIIGPEAPLAAGVTDALEAVGIKVIGPTKYFAQIESSKSFARMLLQKYHIVGNPKFRRFKINNNAENIIEKNNIGIIGIIREFITNNLNVEYVIKADGLRGGKGVMVSGDHLGTVEEGVAYANSCIEQDGLVVIEEKMIGEEFSLMSFCDGEHIVHMIPVQDHKRAYDGDKGPNTGGMGSYSAPNHLLPFLTEKEIQQAQHINEQTFNALNKEYQHQFTGNKRGYNGILYGGFMATKEGVKLVEYNARFGDPESMNILAVLQSDFFTILRAIADGNLKQEMVQFAHIASVCKYAVPEGYPENPVKGELTLSNLPNGVEVFYAAVDEKQNPNTGEKIMLMTGSRAIGVVATAQTLVEAEQLAEQGINAIKGRVFHRRDIGTKELIEKRVKHMNEIRGN